MSKFNFKDNYQGLFTTEFDEKSKQYPDFQQKACQYLTSLHVEDNGAKGDDSEFTKVLNSLNQKGKENAYRALIDNCGEAQIEMIKRNYAIFKPMINSIASSEGYLLDILIVENQNPKTNGKYQALIDKIISDNPKIKISNPDNLKILLDGDSEKNSLEAIAKHIDVYSFIATNEKGENIIDILIKADSDSKKYQKFVNGILYQLSENRIAEQGLVNLANDGQWTFQRIQEKMPKIANENNSVKEYNDAYKKFISRPQDKTRIKILKYLGYAFGLANGNDISDSIHKEPENSKNMYKMAKKMYPRASSPERQLSNDLAFLVTCHDDYVDFAFRNVVHTLESISELIYGTENPLSQLSDETNQKLVRNRKIGLAAQATSGIVPPLAILASAVCGGVAGIQKIMSKVHGNIANKILNAAPSIYNGHLKVFNKVPLNLYNSKIGFSKDGLDHLQKSLHLAKQSKKFGIAALILLGAAVGTIILANLVMANREKASHREVLKDGFSMLSNSASKQK